MLFYGWFEALEAGEVTGGLGSAAALGGVPDYGGEDGHGASVYVDERLRDDEFDDLLSFPFKSA